ncbi:hypothetical protein ACIGO8_25290 [Streptomyces sp. NPDC053493]|uniref:hypothetical protein n=1 Tax=Streptomyces sp. NPDC053493 TaxID=3365705 RepID=UPI0037D85A6D
MAVGFVAGPASAAAGAPSEAGVQPVEIPFPGGGPVCAAGETPLRVEETTFVPGTVVYDIPGDGTVSITVVGTGSNQTFSFSVNGEMAARTVYAKGGTNQNRYDYDAAHGFPNGISSDALLHAPVNAQNGQYFALSHIDFCFIPSPYNGGGTA